MVYTSSWLIRLMVAWPALAHFVHCHSPQEGRKPGRRQDRGDEGDVHLPLHHLQSANILELKSLK